MKRIITATLTNNKATEMKGNVAAKQYLIENGFRIIGACNCGGSYTTKMHYDTTVGVIRVHLKAQTFLIEMPGSNFVKHPISELKNTIDEVNRNYEAFTPAPKN
jgi:hypothetical protein